MILRDDLFTSLLLASYISFEDFWKNNLQRNMVSSLLAIMQLFFLLLTQILQE